LCKARFEDFALACDCGLVSLKIARSNFCGIAFNGTGTNTILTDGPLNTGDPGFKRQNDTDTDIKADWETNPSAVTLNRIAVAPVFPATLIAVMTLTSGAGLAAVALRRKRL
jgi:hypothetical protein